MRQMFFTTEPVTHHREVEGGVSERGIPLPPVFVDRIVEGVTVEPGRPDVSGDGSGERLIEGYTLYFVPAYDYAPGDEFTVRGKRFRALGDSDMDWSHPDAWLKAGNIAYLGRVTG